MLYINSKQKVTGVAILLSKYTSEQTILPVIKAVISSPKCLTIKIHKAKWIELLKATEKCTTVISNFNIFLK